MYDIGISGRSWNYLQDVIIRASKLSSVGSDSEGGVRTNATKHIQEFRDDVGWIAAAYVVAKADKDYVTNTTYPTLLEEAASTEENKKYLLMKDATGNIRRVPSYDNA